MSSNKKLTWYIVVLFLVTMFAFPRLLIAYWGTSNPWTSYLYQYVFGLMVFGVGILLASRSKAYQRKKGRDFVWMKWLWAGFIILAALHAVWIVVALELPSKGALS